MLLNELKTIQLKCARNDVLFAFLSHNSVGNPATCMQCDSNTFHIYVINLTCQLECETKPKTVCGNQIASVFII